eukprot:scaffold59842_cov64-Phaeocystis_antarctica.AAC.3
MATCQAQGSPPDSSGSGHRPPKCTSTPSCHPAPSDTRGPFTWLRRNVTKPSERSTRRPRVERAHIPCDSHDSAHAQG